LPMINQRDDQFEPECRHLVKIPALGSVRPNLHMRHSIRWYLCD
jgi:hypothetical protein